MKLSIIIPVYNEEPTVAALIEKVLAVTLPNDIQKEILIIDDGSTDNTPTILKEFESNPSIRIFYQKQNAGKTAGVRRGLQEASGDFLIIQDADLEYFPSDYPKLLEPILNNECSVVYGSRFKGSIKNMKLINRLANNISNITFNLIYKTKLSDINTCYKLFKRDVIKDMAIHSAHFSFETEVTTKLINQSIKIQEVPIRYEARTKKEGKKINWSKAIDMYLGMFRYRKEKNSN